MAAVDGDNFQFKIPKDLPTDTMQQFQDIIESVDQDSLEESASYDFQNLIKKINKPSSSRRRGIGGSRVMAEQEAVVYHSAEYVVDSEDEDDAYFEGERELRTRKAIDFSDAEKRHREMIENNERMKAQKLKETTQAKRAALKGTSISLTDHEDNKEDSDDDAGRPSASPSPSPRRKTSVSLDSDDDSDRSDDESTSRRPPPKSASDVESEDGQPSQATATTRRAANNAATSSRRLVALEDSDDDVDSENENKQQATQPLPEPSRTPTQTNKRRIILEDSEDEDDDEHTQGSPAKKKHAFEE